MKNLLSSTEDLMTVIIHLLLGLWIFVWLFFGIMYISNSSMISVEANHVLVGTTGLLLCFSSIGGLYAVQLESLGMPVLVGFALVALSITFAYLSPIRLGALLGQGDPSQYAPALSGFTGILMMLRAVLGEISRRKPRKTDF